MSQPNIEEKNPTQILIKVRVTNKYITHVFVKWLDVTRHFGWFAIFGLCDEEFVTMLSHAAEARIQYHNGD